MKRPFDDDPLSAAEALEAAQRIAWAPMVFQCAVALRQHGVLAALVAATDCLALSELQRTSGLGDYALTVLLEAGSAADLVRIEGGQVRITKTGYMIERDAMTRINMSFVRDVCYQGLDQLSASLESGAPAGLHQISSRATVYEALGQLPASFETSWYAFDHFYSDGAFPVALPYVLGTRPRTLLDVGGNTGKWASLCLDASPELEVTVLDHPAHTTRIRTLSDTRGYGERLQARAVDLLDHTHAFPGRFDVVWMSQFLVCFAEADIVSLLQRARAALNPGGRLFILETFWDRQSKTVSRFSLQQLSLYFTCIANGKSRVYDSKTLLGCIRDAGFEPTTEIDELGQWHTLLMCSPKS